MKQGSTLYYLHVDHLGSSSVTSDGSGNQIGTQVYFPFGTPRASTGNLQTDFTFTGQKIDASDGLMYYNARYYDAALGRFISADTIVPDPANPQSLSRYSYVHNNPIRYTDPTGHCGPACPVFVIGGAEVVKFVAAAFGALIVSEELKQNAPAIANALNNLLNPTSSTDAPPIDLSGCCGSGPSLPSSGIGATQPLAGSTTITIEEPAIREDTISTASEERVTSTGEKVKVRPLDDKEVKNNKGWEEQKARDGYGPTDRIYIDPDGNYWVGPKSGGQLDPWYPP